VSAAYSGVTVSASAPDRARASATSRYLNHEAAPGTPRGRDGFRHTVELLRGGFPDLCFVIEDVVAEDDRVVVRCLFEGTHDGTFLGIAPTGRRVSTQHIHIYRVEDDMVAEHWACRDDIGGLRQLGIQSGPR
jgi:predicted ester cyclase